jgi:hypothetical protein
MNNEYIDIEIVKIQICQNFDKQNTLNRLWSGFFAPPIQNMG